uniref:Prokaryotic-type class I peptide chain release factors domain-containing protein n=1 Tax=Plectus sambesii TaxID=2011161 RepID=A0A914XQK7_9BILA
MRGNLGIVWLSVRHVSSKTKLKGYVFPKLEADDVEQSYISGWGPGGQKVNTAVNAVQLKHIPSNIVVKVHESRNLHENVTIAYERLKLAVDRHINGENCYEEQLKRLDTEKSSRHETKDRKRRELKAEWKQRMDTDKDGKDD